MNRLVVAACVLAALLSGGAAWVSRHHGGETDAVRSIPASPTASEVAESSATGEPELSGIRTIHPAVGTVGRLPGPFDDRFSIAALRFNGSAVRGTLNVTSDVSDILDLQVLAGFYDSRGRYLGENRFTYHLNEEAHADAGPPSELQAFTIAVPPRLVGRAKSAALGVPVLVNE